MKVKVNGASAEEWVKVLISNKDFIDRFTWEYNVLIDFIKYIDEHIKGGWEGYYRRVWYYGESYDYVRELYTVKGLGKDKVWDFISNHKGAFDLWLRLECDDDYILKFIKDYNGSIIEFKDSFFNKDEDMCISLCCKFIGYLSVKLFNFVAVNDF